MEYKRLEEVCTLITDGTHQTPTYTDTGYIFLSSKNVTSGKIDWKNVKYVSKELHEELSKRVIPKKNDILLAKNGTTGVAAIVDKDISFDIYVSLALLRPKEEINPKYLLRVINSQYTKRQFDKRLKGIGVKNLHLKEIKDITIPIPSIEIQKRIVEVLDKAQSLIEKKKEQIDLLDELVKSRFIEMFGDPVSNSKEWKKQKINEVAPVSNYKGEFDEEKIWLLNLDMVESNSGRIIDFNYVDKEEIGSSTCTFDTSNVLYSKLRPYLNKVVIPDRIGYATSEMIPLKPNKKVLNREYLTYSLRNKSFVDYISEKVSGAKMPRVVMNDFKSFELPIPPIELQNEFAEFVTKIDEIKSKMETSLSELEDNFNSLMQKAFKGELFN